MPSGVSSPHMHEVMQCILVYLAILYRQAYAKRSHAGVVFTHWFKNGVFAPQGRHVAPINVKFGSGKRITGPFPRAKFHIYRGRNVGIQPLKLSNFRI